MSNDRELYKDSNMVGFVGKPFTSQELWRCLMRFFTPLYWKIEDEEEVSREELELRQKLINNFVSKNSNKFEEIINARDNGDIELAHRLVHTLKSNAGQLNKTTLQHAADIVENHLKNGNDLVTPEQLDLLENELKIALEELTPLAEPDNIDTVDSLLSGNFDVDAANELFAALKPLIEDNDYECLDYIKELKKYPNTAPLIRLLEDFDFIKAIEVLSNLQNPDQND